MKIFNGPHPDEEVNKWIQINLDPICDIVILPNIDNGGEVRSVTITYKVSEPNQIKEV